MVLLDFERFVKDVDVAAVRGRRGVVGPTWNDLRVLLRLLEVRKPVTCLEVGIHEGHTAALLLDFAPGIGQYVGVDRKRMNTMTSAPAHPGRMVEGNGKVSLLLHEKGTRGIPWQDVPHAPFDWALIDSDHSRTGTKQATEWARHLIHDQSIVIWHDYNVPSQYHPGGPVFGVTQYLDELTEQGAHLVGFRDPKRSSSFVFQFMEDTEGDWKCPS